MHEFLRTCPEAAVWVDRVEDEGDRLARWHRSAPSPCDPEVASKRILQCRITECRRSQNGWFVQMTKFHTEVPFNRYCLCYSKKIIFYTSLTAKTWHYKSVLQITLNHHGLSITWPSTFLPFISTNGATHWSNLKTPTPSQPFLSPFTAHLHNSLARQSSKNIICLVTAAAPPPFFIGVRGETVNQFVGLLCVCVRVYAVFQVVDKEV